MMSNNTERHIFKSKQLSSNHNNSSLEKRYQKLFSSQKYVDCSFRIDENLIQCHKLILAAASPVFEAMFYGPLSSNEIIEIEDISFNIFNIMINFIYTNELKSIPELTLQDYIEIYYCSKKYLLCDLTQSSLQIFKVNLRFENILSALDLVFYMNFSELIEVCATFFEECCSGGGSQFKKCILSSYYHISKECMKYLIASCKYSTNLIWFTEEWCHYECNLLETAEENYKMILKDLNFKYEFLNDTNLDEISALDGTYCMRHHYKALRPFVINENGQNFQISIKTEYFMWLLELIVNSRLKPVYRPQEMNNLENINCDLEYQETLKIEIVHEDEVISSQIFDRIVPYNCDMNIPLKTKILISPNKEYLIIISWNNINGVTEYPCSLLGLASPGINFVDQTTMGNGSILKGIKFLNH